MSFGFLIFVLLPALEIALFLLVGMAFGWGETLLLTLLTTFIGLALSRRFWLAGSSAFRSAATDPIDWGLRYLSGPLLIIPGFLTDFFGFLLLFPRGRRFFRFLFGKYLQIVENRAQSSPFGRFYPFIFGQYGDFSQNQADFTDFVDIDSTNNASNSVNNVNNTNSASSDTDDDIIDVDFEVKPSR